MIKDDHVPVSNEPLFDPFEALEKASKAVHSSKRVRQGRRKSEGLRARRARNVRAKASRKRNRR